jgi:uncharacterized protein YqeY
MSTVTLKDRIQEDMKDAMRSREGHRLTTIRGLLAAVKQREIDERTTLDDAGVVAVVDKLVKQRRDSVAAFRQGGREDLAVKEEAEAAMLQAYLPQRLSAAEVAAELAVLLSSLGATGPGDMGRVMAAAKAQFGGRADMATVSAAVKLALAKPSS